MMPLRLAHERLTQQRTGMAPTPTKPLAHDSGPVPLAVLAHHGRSFRLAGRLLPRAVLADAAELYAFCRAVDDLADESSDQAAARDSLGLLRQALLAGQGGTRLADGFAALHARTGADPQAAALLVGTVLQDLDPVRMADEAALLRYAYGAAGTVGLMMCAVLGVDDPDARLAAVPHAIDLGVAMQLTNVARDVAEDAARDRLYLPASWLPAGFGPADVPGAPAPVFAAVQRLLALADRRYRSGGLGLRHLPPRVRPAIRAAARLYEEIGVEVLRRGPGYLHSGRCVVPGRRRMALLAAALVGGTLGGPHGGALHDPALHAALRGLPGVPA
jgi:phytoene synthase